MRSKIFINVISFSLTLNAFAYHPISDKGPFDYIYPTYPKIEYGLNHQDQLAKKGEYLAKAGDCLACHTNMADKGLLFAGGLPIATPFGTFYSPNITPDPETGIGKWNEQDFIKAMRHGAMPNGSNYFPVFPYLYFAKIHEDDLKAIFAYLQKVPPIKRENTPLPFPFNLPGARLSLYGWKMLFFYPYDDEYKYDDTKSVAWNRGAYLVEGLGHCSMCHTPLNIFGAPKDKYYLTGAFVDGYWAPNITRWGLKGASKYEVTEVFADGRLINKAGPVAGPMADVNHNSLRYLTSEDQAAIVDYLTTVVSEEPFSVDVNTMQEPLKRGKQVYINACIHCHQEGILDAPRIGDEANWKDRLERSGKQALYRRVISGYNQMPPKGACVTCSNDDLVAAVDYIVYESLPRNLWQDYSDNKKFTFTAANQVDGKTIYNENCAVCHNTGRVGAPKIGDKAAWKILLRKNMDGLITNTLTGTNNMPPKGGCKYCTTPEIIAAVKYIVDNSKDAGNYDLW